MEKVFGEMPLREKVLSTEKSGNTLLLHVFTLDGLIKELRAKRFAPFDLPD